MSEIKCKLPWPKVQFKTETGHIYDGYVYLILGDSFYISQNQSYETMGLAQNWVINHRNVIKFYDDKYGLKCTCDAHGAENACHTLCCNWRTINTDLL